MKYYPTFDYVDLATAKMCLREIRQFFRHRTNDGRAKTKEKSMRRERARKGDKMRPKGVSPAPHTNGKATDSGSTDTGVDKRLTTIIIEEYGRALPGGDQGKDWFWCPSRCSPGHNRASGIPPEQLRKGVAGIRKAVATIIFKASILRIALHHRAAEYRKRLREEGERARYLRKQLETHFPHGGWFGFP